MVKYLELHQVQNVKRTDQPRHRLDSLGYTLRGGSPTDLMLLIAGRWRRVYVIQFSNAGSRFVKVNREQYFLGNIESDLESATWANSDSETPQNTAKTETQK